MTSSVSTVDLFAANNVCINNELVQACLPYGAVTIYQRILDFYCSVCEKQDDKCKNVIDKTFETIANELGIDGHYLIQIFTELPVLDTFEAQLQQLQNFVIKSNCNAQNVLIDALEMFIKTTGIKILYNLPLNCLQSFWEQVLANNYSDCVNCNKSCCDSCAEGKQCESKKKNRRIIKQIVENQVDEDCKEQVVEQLEDDDQFKCNVQSVQQYHPQLVPLVPRAPLWNWSAKNNIQSNVYGSRGQFTCCLIYNPRLWASLIIAGLFFVTFLIIFCSIIGYNDPVIYQVGTEFDGSIDGLKASAGAGAYIGFTDPNVVHGNSYANAKYVHSNSYAAHNTVSVAAASVAVDGHADRSWLTSTFSSFKEGCSLIWGSMFGSNSNSVPVSASVRITSGLEIKK